MAKTKREIAVIFIVAACAGEEVGRSSLLDAMTEAGQADAQAPPMGDAQAPRSGVEVDCGIVRVEVRRNARAEIETTRSYAEVLVSELGGEDIDAWRCDIVSVGPDPCSGETVCSGEGELPELACEQATASLGDGVVRVSCGTLQTVRYFDASGALESEEEVGRYARRVRIRAR